MPLKSPAAPGEGPLPENSTIYGSEWYITPNYCPQWLRPKPPLVHDLHIPFALSVAVAGEIMRLTELGELTAEKAREHYGRLVKHLAAAEPVIEERTPDLIEVREGRGRRGMVRFMGGCFHHYHEAVLCYPKAVRNCICPRGADPRENDWSRVPEKLRALLVVMPDHRHVYKVFRLAEREAIWWDPPHEGRAAPPTRSRDGRDAANEDDLSVRWWDPAHWRSLFNSGGRSLGPTMSPNSPADVGDEPPPTPLG